MDYACGLVGRQLHSCQHLRFFGIPAVLLVQPSIADLSSAVQSCTLCFGGLDGVVLTEMAVTLASSLCQQSLLSIYRNSGRNDSISYLFKVNLLPSCLSGKPTNGNACPGEQVRYEVRRIIAARSESTLQIPLALLRLSRKVPCVLCMCVYSCQEQIFHYNAWDDARTCCSFCSYVNQLLDIPIKSILSQYCYPQSRSPEDRCCSSVLVYNFPVR